MYPKLFIENLWLPNPKQEKHIFVCMPFDNGGKFDKRFKDIIENAGKQMGYKIIRSDLKRGNETTQEIWNGIAGAEILLFDLSNDDRYKKPNVNVAYELGVATTIRNLGEMLLIREEPLDMENFPSNIKDLPIVAYTEEKLNVGWIQDRLKEVLAGKNEQKHKLLSIAHQSLDVAGFSILLDRFSPVKDQIYEHELGEREKLSMLRLIDLGIVHSWSNKWRKTECGSLFEFSYCLTKFGEELVKYIQELSKKSLENSK